MTELGAGYIIRRYFCTICGYNRTNLVHHCEHGHEAFEKIPEMTEQIKHLRQISNALTNKMKSLGLLTIIVFMVACRSTVPAVHTEQKDSVAVSEHVTYQDTSIVISGDQAHITTDLTIGDSVKAELPEVTVRSKTASIKVSVHKGLLKADCNCDSTEHKLRLAQTEITKLHVKQFSETQIITEKYVPLLIKILAWIGGGACLSVVILCLRFFKRI